MKRQLGENTLKDLCYTQIKGKKKKREKLDNIILPNNLKIFSGLVS